MTVHMRRYRILVPILAAASLGATGVLLLGATSGATPSKSQTLFRKLLIEDAKTTEAIKTVLSSRAGFIAPEIQFADLTGDARSDAVVVVDNGGAAGGVALYVFSTHGKSKDSELRVVYRSQRLYRANPTISGANLLIQTPRFAAGNEPCCPAKITERSYSWSDAAKTLVRRSSREIDGPG
jgi:hypothetical protein